MKLLKKINNNFALGQDSNGEKIIVEGRGVGFLKMPCELCDFSQVTRTYYDYDEQYIDLIKEISQPIMNVANEIYEKITAVLNCELNQNLPFILADHISFAIERYEKDVMVNLPIYYDLMQLHPMEYELAVYALNKIKERLHVELPDQEKSGIILNIINAEMRIQNQQINDDFFHGIDNIVEIIEHCMQIQVSRDSFNYSRFISHMTYLCKRLNEHSQMSGSNEKMYHSLVEQYPCTSRCVIAICDYLQNAGYKCLNDEERLYLILHINRLCDRELGL